jgi:hypothetical protein
MDATLANLFFFCVFMHTGSDAVLQWRNCNSVEFLSSWHLQDAPDAVEAAVEGPTEAAAEAGSVIEINDVEPGDGTETGAEAMQATEAPFAAEDVGEASVTGEEILDAAPRDSEEAGVVADGLENERESRPPPRAAVPAVRKDPLDDLFSF